MTNKEEFEFFIDQLLDNAFKEFRDTKESKLLQEKLDKMDENCDSMLTKEDKEFAIECFELILEKQGVQEAYIYHKAFKDCVNLLKALGVLA